MLFVLGCKYQSDGTTCAQRAQLIDKLLFLGELRPIALFEFLPPGQIVSIPLAQIWTWSDVLLPVMQNRFSF